MRRFITYAILFALIVLFTLGSGEYIVRSLPNPYKHKHQWMLSNASEVECLIMGSSHTYYGISPTYFLPNTFNLANVSQNPKYDYLLLEKYMPLCHKLHSVVLPVSYFTFFDKSFEEGDEWFYAINYKLYMDIDEHPCWSRYNFEFSNRPVYSGKLQTFLSGKSLPTCDSLGFGLGYVLDAKDKVLWEHNAYITVDRHTADDGTIRAENEVFLRRIAQLCRDNNINLILITPPSWSAYYQLLDKNQLNKTYEIVHKICNDYTLPYFDYLKDPRFLEEDFYDCDHLTDAGAKKFTTILKHDLTERTPWISSNPSAQIFHQGIKR